MPYCHHTCCLSCLLDIAGDFLRGRTLFFDGRSDGRRDGAQFPDGTGNRRIGVTASLVAA